MSFGSETILELSDRDSREGIAVSWFVSSHFDRDSREGIAVSRLFHHMEPNGGPICSEALRGLTPNPYSSPNLYSRRTAPSFSFSTRTRNLIVRKPVYPKALFLPPIPPKDAGREGEAVHGVVRFEWGWVSPPLPWLLVLGLHYSHPSQERLLKKPT